MIAFSESAEVVYNVSRQLNTSLDLDEVLGKVLHLTVDATGAMRGSLFVLDETGKVMRRILARPNQSPEVSRRNINLVMEHGLAGWVYRHQYGALAADTTKDERWVRLPDDKEITGSALVVPLICQERVNGVLALHHDKVRFFDESHLALAAGIAGQAAIAIENARLFTQVKEERENLYTLINAMPIPVVVVDKAGNMAFLNRSAEHCLLIKQTGVPLDQLEGAAALQTALAKLQTQSDNRIEMTWPDGRVFNVSVNEVSQVGTVVALDDITYLKELDMMKTQFVETVSHDLKNPLGVIMGYIQLLEAEQNLSKMGETSVRGIIKSASNMRLLIEELLDLAQIETGMAGESTINDLAKIVRETLLNFSFQLDEKSMRLTTNLLTTPVLVVGNKVRLSQIVSNYVSNALKYTPQGGAIQVDLEQRGNEIWLSVSDNGPGISPTGQTQLFQKFYRVPEIHRITNASGTGLGLSIVKAIVESYGGRVWVKSEVGHGSTFGCVLAAFNSETTNSGKRLQHRRQA